MNERFVAMPNLPQSKVTLACVQNVESIVKALGLLGIRTVFPKKNSLLDSEICCHADMLICHTGGKDIIAEKGSTGLINALTQEGFDVKYTNGVYSPYPNDIPLNTAIAGKFAYTKLNSADKVLIEALNKKGIAPVNVNQGYSKCSVCIVDEAAIITEDGGIAAAAAKNGTKVLLIQKGAVYLSALHCGFIGGATGKINSNTLAITGKLDTHPDAEKIKAFVNSRGVKITELTSEKIIDIGGILPLKEEEL